MNIIHERRRQHGQSPLPYASTEGSDNEGFATRLHTIMHRGLRSQSQPFPDNGAWGVSTARCRGSTQDTKLGALLVTGRQQRSKPRLLGRPSLVAANGHAALLCDIHIDRQLSLY